MSLCADRVNQRFLKNTNPFAFHPAKKDNGVFFTTVCNLSIFSIYIVMANYDISVLKNKITIISFTHFCHGDTDQMSLCDDRGLFTDDRETA